MSRFTCVLLAAGLLAGAGPAKSQAIVHDPAAYASLLAQARTALDHLNELKSQVMEAQRLYDGFNQASNIGDLAAALSHPTVRAFVPEIAPYVAAARGDFTGLGELGEAAQVVREANRLFSARPGVGVDRELEAAGDRAARDVALGRAAAEVGAVRMEGLAEIGRALDGASNARAVLDIQARLAAEQAMIANDQMRMQGLEMAQRAEERLQIQRDRESARAASEARREIYRQGFQ
ncbi:hypothetical protein ASE17_20585 [Phenylobacterium sp. Root77]|jgi:type IV secretion system protein VirB5|uniref:type IV secretion system protein n=1 Tax=unclassified Phenylobacterium TaxID=2640670 RepID=UPI0006F9F3BB|nr:MULTISPECIES: type IV secretion system protein [unclassified Phenylobacterium]KQW67025.1 hypothetical protein ASC73_18020 [Phenylobacterium sp. Root1277]KQW89718.1 hypothetical protein ASC79_18925 [Phenylobacterium sp. Root1290]KRC43593.1 hypothetical protein ASE17_20585 [Phenylobacterium sp. Root77]